MVWHVTVTNAGVSRRTSPILEKTFMQREAVLGPGYKVSVEQHKSGLWTIRVTGPERADRCFTNVYLMPLKALHEAEKVARYTLGQWNVPCKSNIEWA